MELRIVPTTAVDIEILIQYCCTVFHFGPEDEGGSYIKLTKSNDRIPIEVWGNSFILPVLFEVEEKAWNAYVKEMSARGTHRPQKVHGNIVFSNSITN